MKFTLISKAYSQDKDKLKLSLGDSISIYSEKAYRKDQGTYFEAVGNVVIKSGKDTIYGEKASFNFQTSLAIIEGNVRYIGEGITLYGSKIVFNSKDGTLDLMHARVITDDFSIIANSIKKIDQKKYEAFDAEFTTCKDCTESWTIFGDKIDIELGQYVQIRHAMIKAKGVTLLYFPYIALPIKEKRESGLLFPVFYSRVDEGLSYKQPVFWAMAQDKDMTFSPGLLGKRGYSFDLEYRHSFSDKNWMQFDQYFVNDNIYRPGKDNFDVSDEPYFRNLVQLESHFQWTNNLNTHIRFVQSKDLDFNIDFPNVTDDIINASDIGFEGHIDFRRDYFSTGVEAGHRKNLLTSQVEGYDKNYVQIVPKVFFNLNPLNIYQADRDYLHYMTAGFDSDITIFKQDEILETTYLRNANRLDLRPYLGWGWFSLGPVSASTMYNIEFQEYKFQSENEEDFSKISGVLTTEFSFVMDRIFGIAYEKKIPLNKLAKESAQALADKSEKNPVFEEKNFIGKLPSLQSFLKDDKVTVRRNSYRHSQEVKIIHYLMTLSETQGNEKFHNQISDSKGWFDYQDAIQSDLATVGNNYTRTAIPKNNTLELQWNNDLIKKTPKSYNYFKDDQYLRDHFAYSRIGFFNLSQGLILADMDGEPTFIDRLTRLFMHTGYSLGPWNFDLQEYYFHQSEDNILNLGVQHSLGMLSIIGSYNLNSLEESNIRTIKAGVQYRPIDTFGFSALKEFDLSKEANIQTIVQFDIMPNNNCWIFNVNFKDSVVQKRYAFNIVFNFGDDTFDTYKTNFFSFDRLN